MTGPGLSRTGLVACFSTHDAIPAPALAVCSR